MSVNRRLKTASKELYDFRLICCSKIYSLKDIWIFRYSNQKIITFNIAMHESVDIELKYFNSRKFLVNYVIYLITDMGNQK
jgi:hypothetical protein